MSAEPNELPISSAGDEELDALGAYLAHLKGDHQSALAELAGKGDPESIRRHLQILFDLERFRDAAELITDRQPSGVWCDLAVLALAEADELEKANSVITWAAANADRTIWHRCILQFAQARFRKATKRFGLDKPILPGDLTDEELNLLREVGETLKPILVPIEAQGRIGNELESIIVQVALHAESLCGGPHATKLAKLLATRSPLPLALAKLALEHLVTGPDDLPERLRSTHPNSLVAKMFAVLLEAEDGSRAKDAFQKAKSLVSLASTEAERVWLCSTLNEVGQRAGPSELTEAATLVSALLPDNHRFRRVLESERALRSGMVEEAKASLDRTRDEADPSWLQLYANYLLQIGDGWTATDYFARASELYADPHLLRLAAQVAMDARRWPIARKILERLLTREPDVVGERLALAVVYSHQSLFGAAAAEHAKLRNLEPDQPAHAINQAVCLWNAGRLADSAAIFEEAIKSFELPVQALVLNAQLLHAMGRASEGLAILLTQKDKHWDNYRYVQSVLDMAPKAQRDDLVPLALQQIRNLQQQGKAPADVLQQKTLEDLRQEIVRNRERIGAVARLVLENRCPWLFADRASRQSTYWAWFVRTQQLNWVVEDPVNWSQYTVYSTNGYTVRKVHENIGELLSIEAVNPGQPVVADISALLTLHQLAVLDLALDHFGTVIIPAPYISGLIAELERLRPHQPSRRAAQESIKRAVDAGKLLVVPSATSQSQLNLPVVAEHTLEDEDAKFHYYRLVDLIAPIYDAGKISDDARESLRRVAHRASAVDDSHPTLSRGQELAVQGSTLMTLSEFKAFDAVLQTFQVRISHTDWNEIIGDLNLYAAQETVRGYHENLTTKLQQDRRFVQRVVDLPAKWIHEPGNGDLPLLSSLLADSEAKPLLADDRSLQAMVLNSRNGDLTAAFGTDVLLSKLFAEGRLDAETYFGKLFQLMEWRYRFFTPSPEMLLHFATRYSENPPGKALITIARYCHECMEDPGLLAGFELTNPPVSIASRMYLALLGAAAQFVMDLWTSTAMPEKSKPILTEWVTRSLLPPPPKNLGTAGEQLASGRNRFVIAHALLRGCTAKNFETAHEGLRKLAKALEVSDDEYWRIVTEVIRDA